ncbi:nonsense-mediated mRNA decay factor SMG9 isoform X2 [Battus philenor]|uniref:nonsense-mediated mRNA decay factor SMG9 isoform X2 n=1 Tax=Battus philenor TaxID=42288 RepID=UPI0035CFE66F
MLQNFCQREAINRRPVILKSDRETTKDQIKDKQEKEKPPTIILKTREQSTPKDDRPQSPKPQSSEGDGYHPQRIAQNENKDKKIIESKPAPTVVSMMKPVKLLDENLEFSQSAVKFLQDCNTNYLVVGIIGTQGVGKSMILNLIAQSTPVADICTQIMQSHELPNDVLENSESANIENQMENLSITNTTQGNEGTCMEFFKFKMQDIEQIEKGVHCTKGVDMYVTNDRVILLDCQPLWSPSLIDESNSISMNPRCANIMTVDCLEIASFLMSICHVLIAVQDWFADYNFIRYIQTAEMLKPTLSASSTVTTSTEGSESSNDGECQPHLLLLHNRCHLEDFTPDAIKTMQDFYRKAFQKSNLQLHSGMYMYSDTNKNGLHVEQVCKGYNLRNCGPPINLFLLPEIYSDFDNKEIYRGHPPFEQLAKRLRWLILGANRHQITNVPNLSEKGWFQYCSKAWETIRKCTFFIEYERLLP